MKFLSIFSMLLLSACTSLHTVSLTSIPAQRSNKVTAEVSKTIILGFNFDNDFVDDLENQLKNKCPNGIISGILTKDEIVDYFIMFVWKHHVVATGYCNRAGTASNSLDSQGPNSSLSLAMSGEQL